MAASSSAVLASSPSYSPPLLRSSSHSSAKQRPWAALAFPGKQGWGSRTFRCSAQAERWVLEPVGDGDSRHIGYSVPLPSAFELVSDAVTVGRVPEKADVVIPVATVSGLHARLEKKDGNLLVTDLDSTNGTFIDALKLKPGKVTSVNPGSLITFGDTNLAMFRFSKVLVETTAVEVNEGSSSAT